MSWSFAEFTVFGEIRLLTLSSRQDALPVGRVCLVGSRGGVRTVLLYVRIVDRILVRLVVFVKLCRGLEHFVCQ